LAIIVKLKNVGSNVRMENVSMVNVYAMMVGEEKIVLNNSVKKTAIIMVFAKKVNAIVIQDFLVNIARVHYAKIIVIIKAYAIE